MRGLFAAAVVAAGLGACAAEEDTKEVGSKQVDPWEYCASMPPAEKAEVIRAKVEGEVAEALDFVNVGLGLADDETVANVRNQLALAALNAGLVVSDEPVPDDKAHSVEEASCDEEKDYSWCPNAMFYPDNPDGYGWNWDFTQSEEHRSDKHSTTLFYVLGGAWEEYYEEPLPVSVVVQCGSVTDKGTETKYDSYFDESAQYQSTKTMTPLEADQVFCTYDVRTGEEPLFYGLGGTVVYGETLLDGELNRVEVSVPYDSYYGYWHEERADSVELYGLGGGDVPPRMHASSLDKDGSIDSSYTCETGKAQSWINGVKGQLAKFLKFLGINK